MMVKKTSLYAVTYLMEICYGFFVLLASIKAAEAISSPFFLGLTGTAHILTRVLFNVSFGRLSDKVGRKNLMLLGCVLYFISFLILNINTVWAIFLAYILSGLACAIFWPLIEAWIGHGNSNHELIIFLGLFGLGVSGGIATGNLIGGFFRNSAELTVSFACLLLAISSWLIYHTPDQQHGEIDTDDVLSTECSQNLKPTKSYIYVGWLSNFATWTAIGVLRFLFPKICLELGISKDFIGMINAVFYGCWFVFFLIMMKFRAWRYNLYQLVLLQVLGMLALTMMALRPTLEFFFIGFGLFGLSAGMTYFSSMFYGQNGATDRGNKSGFHEMILSGGQLVGPFLGGVAAEFFSLGAPFLMSALVILIVILIEFQIVPKNSRCQK
jgi:MFS family permease